MRHIIYIILFITGAHSAFAQWSDPSWLFTIDAYTDADISDVEVDDDGNTYVSANYQGSLKLEGNTGKLLANAPHMAGVLLKLDSKGKLLWCRGFESAFDNRINDLSLGADGFLYITGFGDGIMHFPGKHGDVVFGREKVNGEYHQPQGIYVAKYSKEGERIWVNFWSTAWGEGKSVAANSKGEVVWSYYHYTDLKIGDKIIDAFPRVTTNEVKVSLAYFKQDGTLIKIEPFQILSSTSNVRCPSVKFDHHDNRYCFGQFSKSIQLSPDDSLKNDGYYEGMDSYLAKYNSEGKYLWSRQFGGQNDQHLTDIDFGDDGTIYGTGEYSFECILMDAIKPAQQSRYEYKAGRSFFYFHLHEDSETDFIRFEEGKRYTSAITGASIDLDVNGQTHIVGYFNDTLQVEDHTIQSPIASTASYTSTWDGNDLTQFSELAKTEKSWASARQVRSGKKSYAIGAMYYGSDVKMMINGKEVTVSNWEHGRASLIYGGSVRAFKNHEVIATTTREMQRHERLQSIEALFACKDPSLAESTTTWYPTLDSIPSLENTWTNPSPCGVVIETLEATLYPNPTEGPVSILLKGMMSGLTQLDIFSERGQLIYTQRIQVPDDNYTLDLDLTSAATGTYIVRITHDRFEKALRLVKVKM